MSDGVAENHSARGRRPHDRNHDFHQRALARPIGTQQAEYFPAIDLHGDALKRVDAPMINLGDVLEIDGVAGGSGGHDGPVDHTEKV